MKKEYLIYKLSEEMKEATRIDNELFPKFDVKRGLRNEDGTGVLVGLTKIGNVVGYERVPGTSHRNHRKIKEFIFLIINHLNISHFLYFCHILPIFRYSVHF